LYGDDGEAIWRSFCETVNDGDGRECVPGSMVGFDGYAVADLIGAYYESGRVTMCFLDAELIQYVIEGADAAAADGVIDEALVPLYADGHHLQHWPNHDNHVHVRLSEEDYAPAGAPGAGPGAGPPVPSEPEPFEAP
jgi:hypothetical protein